MAEFLQTLPMTHAAHVARRSKDTQLQFDIYGWGLPIAKGAAQTIKVHQLLACSLIVGIMTSLQSCFLCGACNVCGAHMCPFLPDLCITAQ